MKMIFAVIRDKDSYAAIGALSEKNIGVTKLASSGGFLREGNTTLMIGVEDSRVEEVMGILRENCAKRTQIDVAAPYPIGGAPIWNYNYSTIQVEAGGATVFVLDVSDFKKLYAHPRTAAPVSPDRGRFLKKKTFHQQEEKLFIK